MEESPKKREVVLVTGGSGFLGQHIVRLLQEKDDRVGEIRVLDLEPYSNKLYHGERKVFRYFEGDILDKGSPTVRAAFVGVDCVIHCAAFVSYEYPLDLEELEAVNVTGTANVLALCTEHHVTRLVYCSTAEVALVPYMKGTFNAIIINQTEKKAQPPATETGFLIPGYPASKLRGERLVLAANDTPLPGGGRMRTVALRPTLLYGEEDQLLIPSIVRASQLYDHYTLVRFGGSGGKQQNTYAGNAAWAHILAKDALQDRPEAVSGLPVLVTDDTPPQDLLRFAQQITATQNTPSRCQLTRWYIPSVLAYLLAWFLELLVKHVFQHVTLPVAPRTAVSYLGSIVYFNRLRAAIHLGYTPLYSADEALAVSRLYYTREKWYRCPFEEERKRNHRKARKNNESGKCAENC